MHDTRLTSLGKFTEWLNRFQQYADNEVDSARQYVKG